MLDDPRWDAWRVPAQATGGHARGSVRVISYEPAIFSPGFDPAPDLVETYVTQRFRGDMSGTGTARLLQTVRPDNSAGFVGIERVVGAVAGRYGSFVLQVTGVMAGSRMSGNWFVVPHSGTGELTGLGGEGRFLGAVGAHAKVTLDYWFDR
ncbi:DUF3224 domain-containing protein [Kribbella sp. NPDC003505]|uniref:DUF3224 domain-containing protein n=1 Tax=Kribbella sp. NPDC003505 TaxID=3154448 RepID=UPI0033B6E37A